MKKRIEEKLGKKKRSLGSLKAGEKVMVLYVQEGKRISYYVGNFLKKKGSTFLLTRRVDRSFQAFPSMSPGVLLLKGEWLSG
jgi:hypothetical protein